MNKKNKSSKTLISANTKSSFIHKNAFSTKNIKFLENKKEEFILNSKEEQRINGFNQLINVDLDKKEKERQSIKHSKSQLIMKNNKKSKYASEISVLSVDHNDIDNIISVLKKEEKQRDDILFLYRFFDKGDSNFIRMLKEQSSNIEDLLFNLCTGMHYQFYSKNNLLFKYGDNGDNFYIILDGSVSILVPDRKYEYLTEEEIFFYLLYMKSIGEIKIFENVLNSRYNKELLPKDMYDNFDLYIVDNYSFKDNSFKIKEGVYVENTILLKKIKEYIDKRTKKNSLLGSLTDNFIKKSNFNNKNEKNNLSVVEEKRMEKTTSELFKGVEEEIIKDVIKDIFQLNKQLTISNRGSISKTGSLNLNMNIKQRRKSEIYKELKFQFGKKAVKNLILKKNEYLEYTSISFIKNLFGKTEKEQVKYQIIQYIYLKDLNTGDKFGDAALDKMSKKRTATIISSSDLHLIYIHKTLYDSYLKDSVEKSKRQNIQFLLSTKIFDTYSKQYFQHKLMNFFDFRKCKQGESIISQGDSFEKFCFLKEGQFEVEYKGSLKEINHLIYNLNHPVVNEDYEKTKIVNMLNKEKFLKLYNGINVSLKEITDINNKNEFNYDKLINNSNYNYINNKNNENFYMKNLLSFKPNVYYHLIKDKANDDLDRILFEKSLDDYMSQRQSFKLETLVNTNIIGIEEFLLQTKNLFSIKCISATGQYCLLSYETYKNKFLSKQSHKNLLYLLFFKKKFVLQNMLVNIKDNKILSFCEKYLKKSMKSILKNENVVNRSTFMNGRVKFNESEKLNSSKRFNMIDLFVSCKKKYIQKPEILENNERILKNNKQIKDLPSILIKKNNNLINKCLYSSNNQNAEKENNSKQIYTKKSISNLRPASAYLLTIKNNKLRKEIKETINSNTSFDLLSNNDHISIIDNIQNQKRLNHRPISIINNNKKYNSETFFNTITYSIDEYKNVSSNRINHNISDMNEITIEENEKNQKNNLQTISNIGNNSQKECRDYLFNEKNIKGKGLVESKYGTKYTEKFILKNKNHSESFTYPMFNRISLIENMNNNNLKKNNEISLSLLTIDKGKYLNRNTIDYYSIIHKERIINKKINDELI